MSERIKSRQGFTLVELSIVIVIIGFLVAGIAAGASMIKQAQIRSVISDVRVYQTALNSFKARFNNQLPGDMPTASSYFSVAACTEGVAANCDGNGDGIIIKSIMTPEDDETRPALKHLALAGMISSGIAVVPTTVKALVPGVNAPASRVSGVGYYLVGESQIAIQFYVGKQSDGLVDGDDLINAALTPEDAFSIDQKLDDAIIISRTGAPFDTLFDSIISTANANIFIPPPPPPPPGPVVIVENAEPNGTYGASSGKVQAYEGADVNSQACIFGSPVKDSYNLSYKDTACVMVMYDVVK